MYGSVIITRYLSTYFNNQATLFRLGQVQEMAFHALKLMWKIIKLPNDVGTALFAYPIMIGLRSPS